MALVQSSGLVAQVKKAPPLDWLKTVGLTLDGFYQQTLDHFTLVLYSTLDRSLLLATHILRLGIRDHVTTYRAVQADLRKSHPAIALAIAALHEATEPISDPRHFYAHRGESRRVELFSDVMRTRMITDFWGTSTTVEFADDAARERLLSEMESDLESVALQAVATIDSLAKAYSENLASLGGVDLPTQDERERAFAMIRYYRGGERPPFMHFSSEDGGA